MKRATDYYPKVLIDTLLPLGRLVDPRWVEITVAERPHYHVKTRPGLMVSRLLEICLASSSDLVALAAASRWLADGPKFISPTLEECRAFQEVEVNVDPKQYRQPFPAVMVDLPRDFSPFCCVLLHQYSPEVLTLCLQRPVGESPRVDGKGDIVTMVRLDGEISIEECINTFDGEVRMDQSDNATAALRVGLNLCLLMTNYGCSRRHVLPKELESDRSLLRRGGEVAARARDRIGLALEQLSLDQSVRIFTTADLGREPLGGSHASPKPHWRKGHWRRRPVHVDRGLVYVGPVFVRGFAFGGERSDTSVEYSEK